MKNNLLFYCLAVIVLYLCIVIGKDKATDDKTDNSVDSKDETTDGVRDGSADEVHNGDNPQAPTTSPSRLNSMTGGAMDNDNTTLKPQPAPAPSPTPAPTQK